LDQAVRPLVLEGIEAGIFPGASITVWAREGGFQGLFYGRYTYCPWSPRISKETLFDLASLTKPIVTALLVLRLISQGKLALDTCLGDLEFIRPWPRDKANIMIADLLSHSSGLPAWIPLYKEWSLKRNKRPCLSKEDAARKILSTGLLYIPGTRSIYSDLGFILLGFIIEAILGMDLHEAFRRLVLYPLGLNPEGLGYRPSMETKDYAPSFYCRQRGRVLMGEVQDLNAWYLGGISGHAGLFGSSIQCAALLSRLLLIIDSQYSADAFPKSLLKTFFFPEKRPPGSTWALGFDTPSPSNSQSGSLFSRASVGHLGYTGTSFWMDLEKGIVIVVLTNRTFPFDSTKSREVMKEFRPRLHDAIMKDLLHLEIETYGPLLPSSRNIRPAKP